jgi:hypothetical protein
MPNQTLDVLGLFSGMNTDRLPEQINQGEYTYALNSVIEPGNMLAITFEEGTKECLNDIGYIIGYSYIPNREIVVAFVVDENNTNSRIVSIDLKTCTSTVLFQDVCLDFNMNYPVRTTFKQLETCGDIVIVFVERNNPVRYLNIDKLPNSCEDLALFTCSDKLEIDIDAVFDSGGAVPSGKYWFMAGYSDEFGELEGVTSYTPEVSIYDDFTSGEWSKIDGCPANTLTSKSVSLKFTNLNPKKDYLALIVVASIDYQILAKKIVVRYNGASEYQYIYSGQTGFSIDIEEIMISKNKYTSAELVTQHDERLILGRLREPTKIDYQKKANNIKVNWQTAKLPIQGLSTCNVLEFDGMILPAFGDITLERDIEVVKVNCNGDFATAGDIYTMISTAFSSNKYAIGILTNTGWLYFAVEHISLVAASGDIVQFSYLFDTAVTAPAECQMDWVTGTDFPPYTEKDVMTGGTETLKIYNMVVTETGEGFRAYKNPLTGLFKSFLGNENYALAVWWEFCNGTFSNAFHIPGTSIEIVNECFQGVGSYLLVDGELEETFYEHADSIVPANDINNPFDCEKFVWELFDTSCITDTPHEITEVSVNPCEGQSELEIKIWEKGTLGYYEETCQKYPDTKDCDGNYIYPHKVVDGVVIMDNVRHHKIPSRRTVSHFLSENNQEVEHSTNQDQQKPYDNITIFPIFLNVSDIEPPENTEIDIVGYHIGFVRRTELNSSILAKGMLITSLYYNKEDLGEGYFFRHAVNSSYSLNTLLVNDEQEVSSVIGSFNYPTDNVPTLVFSPDLHFSQPMLAGSFMHVEQEWFGKGYRYAVGDVEDYVGRAENINMTGQTELPSLSSNVNRLITGQSYLSLNTSLSSLGGLSGLIYNADGVSSTTFLIKCEEDEVGLLKYENECGESIVGDTSLDPAFWTSDQNSIDCAKAHYVSVRKTLCNQYGDIQGLRYIPIEYQTKQETSVLIAGDSYINFWSYFRTSRPKHEFGVIQLSFPLTTLIHGVYESNINVDLRHEGSSALGEVYYPKLANDTWGIHSSISTVPPENCLLEQFIVDVSDEGGDTLRLGKDNIRFYNPDYSRQFEILNVYAPSNNYKSCECDVELINNIAVSEVHNEITDGWKTFRPANILSIPRNAGEVMNIFSFNNSIFAHTTDNLWKVFSTQDRLLSDSSSVYIGSGSIFTQTPQYMYASKEGFGGIQQFDGWYQNNLGYFWLDEKSGRIFMLSGSGLKELSLKGMRLWVNENAKQLIDYPNTNNPVNPFGTGWLMAYDYKNDRLLVTFRRYEFKEPEIYAGIYDENSCEVGKVYFNPTINKFVYIVDEECSYQILDFSSELFCNKSWTLSYSMLLDNWISFHSYIPTLYMPTRGELYSFNQKDMHKHNEKGIYTTYYGQYYPNIVEFVTKKTPASTLLWTSLVYNSEAKIYLNNRYKDVQETFTHLIAWHENDIQQNTGKMSIRLRRDNSPDTMFETITDYQGEVKVYKRYTEWYLNGLYNFIKDQELPVWSNDCTPVSIDKEIISDNIDYLKDYVYLDRLRSNHLMLRFIFDNPEKSNVKLITKYIMPILTQV